MRTILAALLAITFAAAAASAAEIKSTTCIHIAAAADELRTAEITDAGVLALSNVFAGSFIDQPVDVPNFQTLYTITFDIQARDSVKAAAYVLQYGVDATGHAFIYLPGRGEPSYPRNVSTILRNGQDGRWHRASAQWSRAIQPYLP